MKIAYTQSYGPSFSDSRVLLERYSAGSNTPTYFNDNGRSYFLAIADATSIAGLSVASSRIFEPSSPAHRALAEMIGRIVPTR